MAINKVQSYIPKPKENSKTIKTTDNFKKIVRYLLGYSNLKPTKKVENFVGHFFEKLFAKILNGKIVDTNSKRPDIRVEFSGESYNFEVKSANKYNSVVLKLKQLETFGKLDNSYYILAYYDCDKPTQTYQELGHKGFLNKLKFEKIFIIPAYFLSEFELQNKQLIPKQKLILKGKPTDEFFIKLSKGKLEKFLIKNGVDIKSEGKICFSGIDRNIINGIIESGLFN